MDIDQRIDSLEQRLSAMERKSRVWRILALLLLVALVGGVAAEGVFDNSSWAADEKGAKEKVTKFDVVEANTIRLVDNTRRVESKFFAGSIYMGTLDGKTSITTMVNHGSQFGPNHENTAHLIVSNLNSPHTRFSLTGIGRTDIYGGTVGVRNHQYVTEFDALSKEKSVNGKDVTLTPSKSRRYNTLSAAPADIEIRTQRHGGGMIMISNSLGKLAVNLQSSKLNQGVIAVFDVNGKFSRALSAGP